MKSAPRPWLREDEASDYFKVSQSTFRRWVAQGWIRKVVVEGIILYNRRMLDEDLLKKGLVQAPNEPLTRSQPIARRKPL